MDIKLKPTTTHRENYIRTKVITYLKKRNIMYATFATAHYPDIIIFFEGTCVLIEFKAYIKGAYKLTSGQTQIIKKLKKQDLQVLVMDNDSDYETILNMRLA
tara:strand:- start:120 stop:425 length:306 start_codon:yes stop_codon:yes gene_type:complete